MTTNNAANIPNVESGAGTTFQQVAVQTASSSPNIVFGNLSSAFSMYTVVFGSISPAVDTDTLYMYLSEDNGATYLGAGAYVTSGTYVANNNTSNAPAQFHDGSNQNQIWLSQPIPTGGYLHGTMNIFGAAQAIQTQVGFNTFHVGVSPTFLYTNINAMAAAGTSVNAIKFAMSTGNILSGTFYLYGILA